MLAQLSVKSRLLLLTLVASPSLASAEVVIPNVLITSVKVSSDSSCRISYNYPADVKVKVESNTGEYKHVKKLVCYIAKWTCLNSQSNNLLKLASLAQTLRYRGKITIDKFGNGEYGKEGDNLLAIQLGDPTISPKQIKATSTSPTALQFDDTTCFNPSNKLP